MIEKSVFDLAAEVMNERDEQHWDSRLIKIKRNEKRFQRYISRFSDALYDYLKGCFPSFCFSPPPTIFSYHFARQNDEYPWIAEVNNLELFFAKYLYLYTSGDFNFMRELEVPVEVFLKDFFLFFSLNEESRGSLFSFLSGNPFIRGEKEIYFHDIFEHELKAVLEEFLMQHLMINETMTEDTFLRDLLSLFSSNDDVLQASVQGIISSVLSRVLFNISFLFSSSSSLQKSIEEEEIKKIREERDELKKELKRKENELREKEREIKEKENQVSSLTSRLLNKEKKEEKEREEEIEILSEENKSLLRQNRKLQEYHSDLLSKYEKMKERVKEEGGKLEEEKVEEAREVDLNARYLFFMGADIKCRTQIKGMFPNAEFTDKALNLSLTAYDMVVALTGCVDHKYYFKLKEQCKVHGVPFAHCHHSNLDMIKIAIWNVLN